MKLTKYLRFREVTFMASKPSKRPRLIIDVTPEIRRQVKVRAAMEDMTVSEWVLGLIADELEEDEDIRVALERLNDLEDSISLEEYRQQRLKVEQQGGL
jgi:hypothetical protein